MFKFIIYIISSSSDYLPRAPKYLYTTLLVIFVTVRDKYGAQFIISYFRYTVQTKRIVVLRLMYNTDLSLQSAQSVPMGDLNV